MYCSAFTLMYIYVHYGSSCAMSTSMTLMIWHNSRCTWAGGASHWTAYGSGPKIFPDDRLPFVTSASMQIAQLKWWGEACSPSSFFHLRLYGLNIVFSKGLAPAVRLTWQRLTLSAIGLRVLLRLSVTLHNRMDCTPFPEFQCTHLHCIHRYTSLIFLLLTSLSLSIAQQVCTSFAYIVGGFVLIMGTKLCPQSRQLLMRVPAFDFLSWPFLSSWPDLKHCGLFLASCFPVSFMMTFQPGFLVTGYIRVAALSLFAYEWEENSILTWEQYRLIMNFLHPIPRYLSTLPLVFRIYRDHWPKGRVTWDECCSVSDGR
jgi:hypothetical protein